MSVDTVYLSPAPLYHAAPLAFTAGVHVLGGTVVGILAFSAIGLSPTDMGEYAGSLFWVILYSMLLSWLFAITLTPLLCAAFLKVKVEAGAREGHRSFPAHPRLAGARARRASGSGSPAGCVPRRVRVPRLSRRSRPPARSSRRRRSRAGR